MYAGLIDDLCREAGLSVAFLAVDATPPFFDATVNADFPTSAEARGFDAARRRWLREWRPEALFVIDRWDRYAGTPEAFAPKLRSFLEEVSPLAGRVVIVTQVPVGGWGKQVNLRELVLRRMGRGDELPRLEPDQNEPFRKQVVATLESASADFRNLRVLRADPPFHRPDGSVRYAEGRTFFYADDDHLTEAGSGLLRGLVQRAIDEAHAASMAR
jgi:hypothetical protein